MKSKLFGGIKIFKSEVFKDNRGSFREVYKKKFIKKKNLIFDCLSISKKNVLRGLHIQTKNSQAKFLTVIKGEIFDVAVDLRKKSKTFGKYFSINLSSKNYCSIYIPEGFAHGHSFLMSDLSKSLMVAHFCKVSNLSDSLTLLIFGEQPERHHSL